MIFELSKLDNDQTIYNYLLNKDITRQMIKNIKSRGDILVDGVHQNVTFIIKDNTSLEVIFPIETSDIQPNDIKLDIVYEDDDYLVINKPSNIACIPTRSHPDNTIANALINYYNIKGINATVHLVNRLDRETKGLMLVSKTGYGHHLLSKDIKQVNRIYHLLVEGHLEGSGTINKPILKIDKQMKRVIDERGKISITHYKCLKHIGDNTLVECILETGRTHQIRIHMASINHPLVGDSLYGSKIDEPLYLESVELEFKQPFLNKIIKIKNKAL